MKKDVTEARTFCDFCEEDQSAPYQCIVGKEDMCRNHALTLEVTIGHQRPGFRAYLCPLHAQPLQPFLAQLMNMSGGWEQYNVARLAEILEFLKKAVPVA